MTERHSRIMGIDCGKFGGVSLISTGPLKAKTFLRMPMMTEGKRDYVDVRCLNETFGSDIKAGLDVVVIEQVGAMPNQGVTSMFNFGRSVGAVTAWAHMISSNVVFVTPQKWKKHFGLSKDKRASLDLANEKWPSDMWQVLRNDGVAEAALIAQWYIDTN